MSRMTDLLAKGADALDDGQIPLMDPFLSDNEVTFDECTDMAGLMAAGMRLIVWAMQNPKAASAAFQGAQMEILGQLMACWSSAQAT